MVTPIRILLVDDHTLFRRGLIALLSQDEAQKTTDPLSFDVMAELIKTVPPRPGPRAAAAALTGTHRRALRHWPAQGGRHDNVRPARGGTGA